MRQLFGITMAGALGSTVLCVGLFGLVVIGDRLQANDSGFRILLALAVAATAGFIARVMILADDPSRSVEEYRIFRTLILCSIVAGLVVLFAASLPTINRWMVTITRCRADEASFCFGLYVVWAGVGFAVGKARRSLAAALTTCALAMAAAYVGLELICEPLNHCLHGFAPLALVSFVPGVVVGLSLGLALVVLKPQDANFERSGLTK